MRIQVRSNPIAQQRLITKWNILALIVLVIGGAATLGLDQLWLQSWSASGVPVGLGKRVPIDLPVGNSLVYYESPVSVPRSDVTLQLYNADNDRIAVGKPETDISYSLLLSGWTGRALWKLDLKKAGRYTVLCHNHNFAYDSDIPADDRIVFLKQPDSLAEVSLVRTFVQVTGATITGVLCIVFYLLHGVTLAKHRLRLREENIK